MFEKSKVDSFLEDLAKHDQEPVQHEILHEQNEENEDKTPRIPASIVQASESSRSQNGNFDKQIEENSVKTEPSTSDSPPNVLKVEAEQNPMESPRTDVVNEVTPSNEEEFNVHDLDKS